MLQSNKHFELSTVMGSTVSALATKASAELRQTLESEVRRMNPKPIDALALLDALDEIRLGLGVAIGRGEAGEDARYEQLGLLVDWMYHELGAPQGSRYAVVQRAKHELSKRGR